MKILIEESVLRQALEALHRSIERMVFAEPWSAAEKDIDVAKKAIASMQSHLDAEIEKAGPADWDINSMDAAVWAKAFAERFTVWSQAHGVESDTFGLMVGWFANAIMAGYDEAIRRHPAPAVPEGWRVLFERAAHHLKLHALEYGHPGQHGLIAAMETMLSTAPTPPTNTGTAPDGKMGIRDICAIQLANGRITREQFEQLFPENAHDSELREAAFKVPLYERNPPIIFDESPEIVLNRAEYNELREAARAVVNFWPEMITFDVIERLRKAL